ncbi:MAG: hypothetical protein LUD16_12900 [Lachnospiraceae bacterium]|nr:hypothetical protein [Lachnospiraceae bacterium]
MLHPGRKEDFDARMKELDQKEAEIKQQEKIRNREKELGIRKTWKKPTWSKIMLVIMTILCFEIVIYTEVVMWVHWDLSALYALVGVAASLAAAIWSYNEKAKAQNTAGGITYDLAMKQQENLDPEPEDAKDDEDGVG